MKVIIALLTISAICLGGAQEPKMKQMDGKNRRDGKERNVKPSVPPANSPTPSPSKEPRSK